VLGPNQFGRPIYSPSLRQPTWIMCADGWAPLGSLSQSRPHEFLRFSLACGPHQPDRSVSPAAACSPAAAEQPGDRFVRAERPSRARPSALNHADPPLYKTADRTISRHRPRNHHCHRELGVRSPPGQIACAATGTLEFGLRPSLGHQWGGRDSLDRGGPPCLGEFLAVAEAPPSGRSSPRIALLLPPLSV
jgi:ribosomal protein L34E